MNFKFLFERKTATLSGIIGPIIVIVGILTSVAVSPWFNWLDNALSDLGHPDSPVFLLFNGILVVSGLITLLFAGHLLRETISERSVLGMIGSLMLFASFVMLIGVGFVNETIRPYHSRIALGFFLALTFASLIYGIYLFQTQEKLIGSIAIVAGLFNTVMLFGGFIVLIDYFSIPITGLAIPEFILASTAYTWIVTLGYRIYRTEQETTEPEEYV